MPNKRQLYDLSTIADLDRDGICASQTPAAGGEQSLTIAGALASGGVATMDHARHVAIYGGSNESARTFTVTGTDHWGHTISETITGPNATTVAGALNFKTVTAVTVDDDTAGAVEVGTYSTMDTPWHALDRFTGDVPVSFYIEVSGTVTWTLEGSFDNLRIYDGTTALMSFTIDADNFAALTASKAGAIQSPMGAIRLALSGLSSGGVKVYVYEVP